MSNTEMEQKEEADLTNKRPGQNSSETDENQPPKTNKTRKYIMFGILGVLVIAAAIYGWNWYEFAEAHESTDNAQIEGHISPVIPRVEGYVDHIYVDDNDRVKKGALLATIDKDQYELGVKQAKADLAGAKAGYQDAKAGLATAQAQEDRARVQMQQANTEKERQQRLLNDQSTTQQQFDKAKYGLESAQSQYKVTQRQVNAARVKVKQAQATIEKAQSGLDNAQLELSYTELHAPIAGRVSKKNIEAGQYIRTGNPVMAIANDDQVWVIANFKEGQISQIKVGQPVSIDVDAFSDTTFQGKVQSVGGATGSKFALLPPDNASGNFVKVEQRIPVKIVFSSSQGIRKRLKPGMNVVPTVKVN